MESDEDPCANCGHPFEIHDFGRRRDHDSCRANSCMCAKYEPRQGFNIPIDDVDHKGLEEWRKAEGSHYMP